MSDLISRQAAIDGIKYSDWIHNLQKKNAIEIIESLPSAQPDPNAGYSDGFADGYRQGQKDAQQQQSNPYSICDLCIYNPPSSMDGKPCCMCVAQDKPHDPDSWSY